MLKEKKNLRVMINFHFFLLNNFENRPAIRFIFRFAGFLVLLHGILANSQAASGQKSRDSRNNPEATAAAVELSRSSREAMLRVLSDSNIKMRIEQLIHAAELRGVSHLFVSGVHLREVTSVKGPCNDRTFTFAIQLENFGLPVFETEIIVKTPQQNKCKKGETVVLSFPDRLSI